MQWLLHTTSLASQLCLCGLVAKVTTTKRPVLEDTLELHFRLAISLCRDHTHGYAKASFLMDLLDECLCAHKWDDIGGTLGSQLS